MCIFSSDVNINSNYITGFFSVKAAKTFINNTAFFKL